MTNEIKAALRADYRGWSGELPQTMEDVLDWAVDSELLLVDPTINRDEAVAYLATLLPYNLSDATDR